MACTDAQPPAWALALAALGLLATARAAARLALWVYAAFLRPAKPLRRRYGAWAVVTGATDGIGRALAFRLAASGLDVVLVGRDPDKLAAVAADLKSKQRRPDAQVRTFVVDFTADDAAARVVALGEFLGGLDVGVLVNNVGTSYPYARYFHEVDEELARKLIRLNVEAVTRVTHAVLPGMVERRRGAIVNMGSGASAVMPSDPLYSVYVATKAYVDQFSRCLYVEYKSKGIDVQCQVYPYRWRRSWRPSGSPLSWRRRRRRTPAPPSAASGTGRGARRTGRTRWWGSSSPSCRSPSPTGCSSTGTSASAPGAAPRTPRRRRSSGEGRRRLRIDR
ncbi:unnamed protein product [Urochloa decumbens]|uniref:Uncharacterized protein n=1 Tax=Urochloa decumbens TaxID=240449 RepID=A0ABC9D4I4_9POAL